MTRQNDSGRERNRQPLVWINGDRVCQLDSTHPIAMLIGEHCCGSVSPIHMEPQVVTSAYIGNSHDVVYDSRARRPSRSDNAKRKTPSSPIFLNGSLQFRRIHLQTVREGNPPERLASNPEQARGFVQGMMGFGGRIHNRLSANRGDAVFHRFRKTRGERQGQPAEVGFVSAAGKCAAETPTPPDRSEEHTSE